MKWNHFISSTIVDLSVIGVVGLYSVMNAKAANDTKSSKSNQQQTGDTTTTKSKLEGQKKGEGDAAFKDLNKHAPGGHEAAPDVKGHNKSGGAGESTGTGSGTGTTGASGGSGSGGGGLADQEGAKRCLEQSSSTKQHQNICHVF